MFVPLDRAAIERVLLPLGQSRLLPKEAYTSAEVLEWERRHFFGQAWVCAGTAAGLAQAGDQRAVSVGHDGVLLARGGDGILRGFFNVCRHRAHELLPSGDCARDRKSVV